MTVRCGIDLGTTYSAISWYDEFNNRLENIELTDLSDGQKTVRSVVYYPGEGQEPVVGDTAWNAARQFSERVIVGIKRSMGGDYKTPPIDGKEYTPQEVSSVILKALAEDAEKMLTEEVKDVIITVPAHFGDNERAATEEAGKIAGLNVIGILSEPHAAALAYSVHKVMEIVDKYLLVYDLGGGTFDVTLIHATTEEGAGNALSLKIETLCKDGSRGLGGLDWDRVLVAIVADKVMQEHGVDVRDDPGSEAILLDNCEKAKRHLSRIYKVSIATGEGHQVDVSRSDFEDRTRDLVSQTRRLLEQVVDDAEEQHDIEKDKIEVVLAGGSTKMPMIREMIEDVMGKPPTEHRNPDMLITDGAAYWAHLLKDGGTIKTTERKPGGGIEEKVISVPTDEMIDLSMYAIGIEVVKPDGKGGWTNFNKAILPVGTKYDGKMIKKEFYTAADGMPEIHIRLYKGDSESLDECQRIMTFIITDLPSDLLRGTRVNVELGYDNNGIIRGSALVETGQKIDIIVERDKIV